MLKIVLNNHLAANNCKFTIIIIVFSTFNYFVGQHSQHMLDTHKDIRNDVCTRMHYLILTATIELNLWTTLFSRGARGRFD